MLLSWPQSTFVHIFHLLSIPEFNNKTLLELLGWDPMKLCWQGAWHKAWATSVPHQSCIEFNLQFQKLKTSSALAHRCDMLIVLLFLPRSCSDILYCVPYANIIK